MKRKRKKKITKKFTNNLKNIFQFIQDSFDDFITIVLWVVLWSVVEPYVTELHLAYKILMITFIILFLNKRLLKFPTPPKKYKKRKTTLKDLEDKIDNLNNRV